MEKSVLKKMIEKYAEMPNLWDKNHENYYNKRVRCNSFQVLLDIYRKFDQLADERKVKTKIQNMRRNYFRAFRKVKASQSKDSGTKELYKPQLWYYETFRFLESSPEPNSQITEFGNSLESSSMFSDSPLIRITPEVNESHSQLQAKEEIEPNKNRWEIYGKFIETAMRELSEEQQIFMEKYIADGFFEAKYKDFKKFQDKIYPMQFLQEWL